MILAVVILKLILGYVGREGSTLKHATFDLFLIPNFISHTFVQANLCLLLVLIILIIISFV